MAETKQAKKSKPRKSSASSSKSKAKAKAPSSANGASAPSQNGHGVAESIGPVVQKAKLPLLATGAALAGGAAAVIASKNGHQRKVLGVKLPKRSKSHLPSVHLGKPKLPKGKGIKADVRKATGAITDAAKQADEIGKRISRVASSVQTVSETADDAAKKS